MCFACRRKGIHIWDKKGELWLIVLLSSNIHCLFGIELCLPIPSASALVMLLALDKEI